MATTSMNSSGTLYWRYSPNLVAASTGGYKVATESPIQSQPVCTYLAVDKSEPQQKTKVFKNDSTHIAFGQRVPVPQESKRSMLTTAYSSVSTATPLKVKTPLQSYPMSWREDIEVADSTEVSTATIPRVEERSMVTPQVKLPERGKVVTTYDGLFPPKTTTPVITLNNSVPKRGYEVCG
jgi:hypothetical protein